MSYFTGMVLGERKIFPLQVVIPYWELSASRMGRFLDQITETGVKEVGAFIPWQLFESDITHSLHRFFQACGERDLDLSLVVTPELGLHYPYSGLPRELVKQAECEAKTSQGESIAIRMPPGTFYLPSLYHPQVEKRYQTFISRLSSFLVDQSNSRPGWAKRVNVVVGGSLWKSYRSNWESSTYPFNGSCGDRSRVSTIHFQKFLDRVLGGDAEPELKFGSFEEAHRRAFDAESERLFRKKTAQAFFRRDLDMNVIEQEIHTPEADPSLCLSELLRGNQEACGVGPLSKLIFEIFLRQGSGVQGIAAPSVYYTGVGSVSRLSDKDRQYLFLQSLLCFGSTGGSIWIEAEEWLRSSPSFMKKAIHFSEAMKSGGMKRSTKWIYLVPQVWSSPDRVFAEIEKRLGSEVYLLQPTPENSTWLRESEAELIWIDPSLFLSRDKMQEVLRWLEVPGEKPKTLVMPKTPFMTEGALEELRRHTSRATRTDWNSGITFRIYEMESKHSRLFLYDPPEILSTPSELGDRWDRFLSVLGVNEKVWTDSMRTLKTKSEGHETTFFMNLTQVEQVLTSPLPLVVPPKGIVPLTTETHLKEEKQYGITTRLENHGKELPSEHQA